MITYQLVEDYKMKDEQNMNKEDHSYKNDIKKRVWVMMMYYVCCGACETVYFLLFTSNSQMVGYLILSAVVDNSCSLQYGSYIPGTCFTLD